MDLLKAPQVEPPVIVVCWVWMIIRPELIDRRENIVANAAVLVVLQVKNALLEGEECGELDEGDASDQVIVFSKVQLYLRHPRQVEEGLPAEQIVVAHLAMVGARMEITGHLGFMSEDECFDERLRSSTKGFSKTQCMMANTYKRWPCTTSLGRICTRKSCSCSS